MENNIELFQKELEKILKDNYINALTQGSQVAFKTISSMIKSGRSIEDIEKFCDLSSKSKFEKTVKKVVDKNKKV